jgi:hypothetical protein
MTRCALLAFTGSLLATAPAYAESRPAENVIRDLSSALLSRDAARALKLFDLVNGGYAYSFEGTLMTGQKFETWLRQDILGTGRVFIIDEISARGTELHVEATYGIGRPQSKRFYLFRLSENGRIVEWRISHSPGMR